MIKNHRGTFALSSKLLPELISLLEILDIQRHVSVKNLERLIGKIRSMHLAVPGAIGRFYTMQVTLTRSLAVKRPEDNLSTRFHQDIKFWYNLCSDMIYSPIYLAELLHRPASELGYTENLGLGTQGGLDRPKMKMAITTPGTSNDQLT